MEVMIPDDKGWHWVTDINKLQWKKSAYISVVIAWLKILETIPSLQSY